MKKIVLAIAVMMMAGSMNTMWAAENDKEQVVVNSHSVERITQRMADELGLDRMQTLDLMKLNRDYYYLFDGRVGMTDRQYRKAWNKYERKLRHILLSAQYTRYLSHRGTIFVHVPYFSYAAPAPRPAAPRVATPGRNYGMNPGRGGQNPPMASAPRNNNSRPGVNGAPGNGRQPGVNGAPREGNKPQANGNREGRQDRPQAGKAPALGRPEANKGNDKSQPGKGNKPEVNGNGGKQGKADVGQGNEGNKPEAGQGNRNQRRPAAGQSGNRGNRRSAGTPSAAGKEI